MNQEQNNLNPNNFNIQGNNGIPNNKPLQNNQGFNPTFNPQPIVEPMQQPAQSQQMPSYQQPIMQDPIAQHINPVQSENTSNQNLNNKPSKKMNPGLIIGIVAGVVVVVVIFILLISKNNSNGAANSLFGSNAEKITKEEIKKYNFNSIARWGNYNLGVSYLIPNFSTDNEGTFSYLHGHNFKLDQYNIYIEKSLEGATNLYTLPEDINKEKNIDKYKLEYGANGGQNYHNLIIESTKQIRIGNIDTVYFESKKSNGVMGYEEIAQYIGYSFKYNSQYFSVYGLYYTDKENNVYHSSRSELEQILQYIISSFEIYNNESFYELDNNFNLKELYTDGILNKPVEELSGNERQFLIYNNCPACNYILLRNIDSKKIEWDGNYDTLFDAIQKNTDEFRKIESLNFGPDGLLSKFEILNETSETINGIKMKKYIIYDEFGVSFNYTVLYTFVIDENPYIFHFYNDNILEESEYNEEQKQILLEWVDIMGSTMIRMLRFVEFDENLSEWDKPTFYLEKYIY